VILILIGTASISATFTRRSSKNARQHPWREFQSGREIGSSL